MRLAQRASRGIRHVVSGQPCLPVAHYQAFLVTPWSNVVEVRQVRADSGGRWTWWGDAAVGLLLLAGGDVGVALSPLAPAAKGSLFALSALLAAPLVYLFVRPTSQTTVLYSQ